MQPGLSRAIPMAILGFLLGALIVIVLRGLQGLDPLWAAGPGIVVTGFMTAGFFVGGMGAFDPSMSVHGEAAHEHEEVVQAEPTKEGAPRRLLTGSVWQIATLLILLMVVLGGFAALPGGLSLIQTGDAYASPMSVGFVPFELPFGGPEVMVSQLVLFAIFVIWAFLSLIVFAGAIGFVIYFLSRGVTEAQVAAAGGGTAALPAPVRETPEASTLRETIFTVAVFIIVFLVLYALFYYVAIGLILPKPDLPPMSMIGMAPATQLVIISAVNALIFTLLILRTQLVLHVIGIVAGWVAHQLRRIPNLLQ